MAIRGTADVAAWARRSMGMRIVLALVVVARVAGAKPPELAFIQLAPVRDGSAWALVRERDDIAIRRVAPDGTLAEVAVPTDRAIRAIAASSFDDSLWVLTDGPLLERAADGTWRRVMLAPEPEWRGWQPTSAAVIPIEPHRAVVVRACGDSCSEVSMVNSGSSAEPRRFDILLGPAVADGRGGLWTIVHGRVLDEARPIGYAHFHDGRWDAWTTASRAFDGMANRHAEIAPSQLAADGRGGAIAANDDELATIGADGTITNRGSIAREHAVTRGVIAAGDEALVVSEDPSLVVRHFALSPIRERKIDRVPTWRAEHGNDFDVVAAGSTIWIVATGNIFYRSAGAWTTIAGRRAEETRHKVLASVPIDAGLATRPSAPSGGSIGLRPELILPFDHAKYPIYGVGAYTEAVIANGDHVEALFGGGITGIVYGDMWAVALSAGADARYSNGSTHPQLAISAFIGLREYNMHLFDAPLGLRVDARPGTSAVPGIVTFSLAVDPVWFIGVGAYLVGKRD
jgi:hypothetical protein